jgi:hypothetical protein
MILPNLLMGEWERLIEVLDSFQSQARELEDEYTWLFEESRKYSTRSCIGI